MTPHHFDVVVASSSLRGGRQRGTGKGDSLIMSLLLGTPSRYRKMDRIS
jgi:hypothetical protein